MAADSGALPGTACRELPWHPVPEVTKISTAQQDPPADSTIETEPGPAHLHRSCHELHLQPPSLQGPGTGTCREAQNWIPRNGKYCKVLESALSLNFAFNICSPINLCLLPVNCAPAQASIYIPQHCPHSCSGPCVTPRGQGESEGPVVGSSGPTSAEQPQLHGPGDHRHCSLCAKTLPLTRPSLGFFFCFNCFQNRFHVVPK